MDEIVKTQKPVDPNVLPQPLISTVRKEIETAASDYTNHESIVNSNPELNLPTEVKEAGVEVIDPEPKLTKEHLDLGMRVSAEITPVQTEPLQPSMTQEEAKNAEKGNITESRTWFGVLLSKIWQKTGFGRLKPVKT